jgi:tRNA (guanosine-2'-O-)-methyltransferase
VLENVHDPHNVAAVLRSCDAVGAMSVHITQNPETAPHKKFSRRSSGSAAKWIDITEHETIDDCYRLLREEGYAIMATGGGPTAVPMTKVDLTAPVAIVLGNEMRGLSESAMTGADQIVTIPMVGMIRSLNISVACAVLLYEAYRQREAAGLYDASRLSEPQTQALAEAWQTR